MYTHDNSKETRIYAKILFGESGKSALAKCVYFRNDMTVDFFQRWKWYFKYRAALLRVKNPKAYIDYVHGPYEYILPENQYKKKLENNIKAAKSKLTEYSNKIARAKANWSEIFPIEDHPGWKKTKEKKEYYELRLQILKQEYETNFL
jgi:hypothetical protein